MLKRSFLFNLFLVVCFVAGLLFIFFSSLNWLTNHGKETTVPKLIGKNLKEGIKSLEKQGFKIQIDSTFVSYKNPLEILFQEPQSGARVKVGRTIFLTVNRKSPPSIDMPNLVNLSFRNAMLVMQSYRLVMGDTIYRPDVAAGSILEQWYKGKPIAPGVRVPFGSKITLVVGEGLYGEQEVPNLIGMNWAEARTLITSLEFTYNAMWEGTITDSATAVVYMQQPDALNELDFVNKIPKGDMIDVRIMQNPTPELIQKNQPGSKKVLGEYNSMIDSNEQSLNNVPLKSGGRDSAKGRSGRYVPGTNVPSADPNKIKTDPNNTKLPKKTSSKNTSPNSEPVKKPDDNIKNEYE